MAYLAGEANGLHSSDAANFFAADWHFDGFQIGDQYKYTR